MAKRLQIMQGSGEATRLHIMPGVATRLAMLRSEVAKGLLRPGLGRVATILTLQGSGVVATRLMSWLEEMVTRLLMAGLG